jgi:hypothetical protein
MRLRKEWTCGIQRPSRYVVLELVKCNKEHLLWLSWESEVTHHESDGFYPFFDGKIMEI